MHTVAQRFGLITAFALIALTAWPLEAGQTNSLMDISQDGQYLACSNRDSGTVTIIDLRTHNKRFEFPVGPQPEGVSFLGASHRLGVAVYGADQVVFFDADTAQQLGHAEVFDEPYGLVSNKAGDRVFVTLDYPGRVVEIDTDTFETVREIDAGKFIRGIAISPTRHRLFVTEFYSTAVHAIDLEQGKVVDHWQGATTDNLLRQITLHPTRGKAYLPHIRSRVTSVHGEGSIFPYVTVLDITAGNGRRRKRIPMDAFRGNLVTANPWETAITPDGRRAFVIFSGTNDMFACDVIDDDYRELGYSQYVQLGANPRALRVAPDGHTVYVYNALDFAVVAYDAQTLERLAEVTVTENPLGDEILAGKRLFYAALQPMVGRRWIACSSP